MVLLPSVKFHKLIVQDFLYFELLELPIFTESILGKNNKIPLCLCNIIVADFIP